MPVYLGPLRRYNPKEGRRQRIGSNIQPLQNNIRIPKKSLKSKVPLNWRPRRSGRCHCRYYGTGTTLRKIILKSMIGPTNPQRASGKSIALKQKKYYLALIDQLQSAIDKK